MDCVMLFMVSYTEGSSDYINVVQVPVCKQIIKFTLLFMCVYCKLFKNLT